MKLLLAISSLKSGGAERVLSMLANEWGRRGVQVTVVTTHDGGAAPDYFLDPRIRLVSLDRGFRGIRAQYGTVAAIRKEVIAEQPDVVVSFLNYTNILVLLATRGLGTPVVVSERLDPSVVSIGPLWSALRRLTYRWTSVLVAQTPTAANRYEPIAPGRVRTIPNPVMPLSDQPGADDPVFLDGPTILAAGRLHPQKGFDTLVTAMRSFHRRCPSWKLIILGEGAQRASLEAQINELGLTRTVVLPGRVRNPWPWLLAADAFVMSSRSEGFPNALCEAMAAGLPVVSTDCPSGPSDLISHGVDGLLVPVDDPDALSDVLVEVAESAALRRRLGLEAARIQERYDLPSVMALWDEALDTALGRRI